MYKYITLFVGFPSHSAWILSNINLLCTKVRAAWNQQTYHRKKLLSSFFKVIQTVIFSSENATFIKWFLEIKNLLNLAIKVLFDCFNHDFTSCWCHRESFFGTMRYPWVSCQKNTMCLQLPNLSNLKYLEKKTLTPRV